MRPVMPRGWCFFLLAVFLLGGVAIQAAALYLFAIIVPVFLFQSLLRESRFPLGGIGLALLVAYFIFVFNNLLQIPLDNGVGLAASPRGFMVGELSSAVGVSALFLLGFSRLRPRQAAQTQDRCQAGKTMKMFCYGMGAGSFVLFVYGLIQCASGFDFNTLNAYRPDRLLPNGLYRISGFASHPVPFAGVALAVLVFFAYLTAVPPFAERRMRQLTGLVCVLHFVLVLLSGSRMAAITALIMTFGIFGYHLKVPLRRKMVLLALGVACALIGVVGSGLIYRFQESLGDSAVGGFGERATFWKVHWAIFTQHPWFGAGVAWLRSGGREAYYNALGLAAFDKKFNAHNIFLELLAGVGMVGCAGLTACLIVLGRMLRTRLQAGGKAVYYHALCAALAAELLLGLTQNTLGDAPVVILLLGFLWVVIWDDIIA